jgi:cell wall assembly regulator SMI1
MRYHQVRSLTARPVSFSFGEERAAMRDVWLRIEAVLRATAPDLYADLAKAAPATAQAIAAAEDRIGFALPEDVRASYAVHDGSGEACILPQSYGHGCMNGVALLSLDEVVRDTQMWRGFRFDESNHSRARPDGPIRRNWWNRRWVPVTWDGGGDHLCLDFDAAPGGVCGQVICFSHETGPVSVVADSWKSYLERVATDLETGRLLFGTDAEFGNSKLRLNPAEPATAPDPTV